MHVFCDFDGTISIKDITDEILTRFALPEWELIEAEWKLGRIGSAECMQRQIALLRVEKAELDKVLDTMEIDPTFINFVKYCQRHNMPLTVISDGVDYFIRRIFLRYGLANLRVVANKFMIGANGTYSLSCPYHNPECGFGLGVCKCQQMQAIKGPTVFVGDGRSDFCAVTEATQVFAKKTLANYCAQNNIAYNNYSNFADVERAFELPSLIYPEIAGPALTYNIG